MLLEEKDDKTFQRMTIAGVSRFKILTGKFFTIFLIAIIQIFVMILFSHLALKVEWGDISLVISVSVAAAFTVAGLGSFIAALTYKSNNYKMANIFESAIIQGMALLGGSFFPVDVMPAAVQKFSFLSISGIALKAYLKVMLGFTSFDVIHYIFILAGLGVLFTLFAVLTLREKEMDIHAEHNKTKTVKA